MTRKRKKSLSAHLPGSSADEDSEHEPVKASNYGGGEGEEGGGEEEEGGEEEVAKGEQTKEKQDEKGNGAKDRESAEGSGGEEAVKAAERETDDGTKAPGKENKQRATSPPQPRPNSFLYSHQQNHAATYPRPPPAAHPPSRPRPDNPGRGRPAFPIWISPTRLPGLHQASSFHATRQPDWNQPVPVRHRKTRGGRTRAVSMNLDLELGRTEDRVRTGRTDAVRAAEAAPGRRGCVGVSQGSVVGPKSNQQVDPLPCLVRRSPPLPSSSSGWIDQSPPGSSAVVLRRSGLDPRDKTRAWRRHTVVV